jgi:selenocysteine lyase/cysteine desulfurase
MKSVDPSVGIAQSTTRTLAETRKRLREQMPVTAKWAYLDHAAVAPISQPAATAIGAWLEHAAQEGDTAWPDWSRQVAETRRAAATLIGANEDEIALVANTTAGINFVAEGLDWRSGDNVVTLDEEFPSNLYPWMHLADRGVETRLVPTRHGRVDYDQLEDRCDERTRVISVSWVGFANGCRRDLRTIGEIASRRKSLLFVDAIQGLGAFPLDVRETPIDFLAADGHKWLLGPEGAGIAYLRRDRLPLLRATGVGWNSVVQGSDFSHIELRLRPNAARYEGGTLNMAGMMGMGASIGLLSSLGVENIAAAILEISDLACAEVQRLGARVISPRDGDERSGILSFEMPGADVAAVRRHLLARGVAAAYRHGRVRVSPHAYNDEADISRLIEALRTFESR